MHFNTGLSKSSRVPPHTYSYQTLIAMPARTILLLMAAAFVRTAGVAQAPTSTVPLTFEVATIKPSKALGWRLQPTSDGYTGMGITLRMLVQEAYGVYDDKLLSGGPAWINSDKFDLEAKFDATEILEWNRLTFRQRADMLQPLLAERFEVRVHHETKSFPVYNLVLANGGPKLHPTGTGISNDGGVGITCRVLQSRPGYTQRQDCTVASLDGLLRQATGRSVVDKSGLTGHYDFELRWTPNNASPTEESVYTGPSIFVAVQEQLGLKLAPAIAPLDVLVIDHVERPSEN